VVAETKIKLADGLFDKIMANKSTANYDTNKLDFQDDGVERMLTSSDYAPNKDSDVFVNYVDGDTTHFTTYNGLYTVKVRYLGVDTPESTSEIEVWGKSASNFNKGILKAAKHILVQWPAAP
jgi:endonuclease YncB( thermonuclease family)